MIKPITQSVAYRSTAYVEKNSLLNRSLVDIFGVVVPWAIMANNKDEKREKLTRFSIVFVMAFLSPFITLPLSNRFTLRYISKLTKNFLGNENHIIRISNQSLTSATTLKKGLADLEAELSEKFSKKKQKAVKISFKDVIENCGNDYEKLRKKLIFAKNLIFASDYLFTSISIGSASWITNWSTKKLTGRKGFSAEYNMANKDVIEKRAEKHEQTKKKKYLSILSAIIALGIALPTLVAQSLLTQNPKGILKSFNKRASLFDYQDGIFMKRLPMLLMALPAQIMTFSAARNKTELKDNLIRFGSADLLFYGGDLALTCLFSKLLDNYFNTRLVRQNKNKNFLDKVFPRIRSLEVINKKLINYKNLVQKPGYEKRIGRLIPQLEKSAKYAMGLYWTNFIIICVSLGFGLPALLNKMIKKDVTKNLPLVKPNRNIAKEFFEKYTLKTKS